jgi:hypothetical protein
MTALQPILGSRSKERVLVYLFARDEGYAREMARFYGAGLDPIQKQLDRLEVGGVLVSRAVGRTRLYSLNPRYPFLPELRGFLSKAISFYPQADQDRLLVVRRRPRRRGKPL